MIELATFFIIAFSTLFTLVNPIALTDVYLSIVEQFETEERTKIALKGTITAFTILIIFSFVYFNIILIICSTVTTTRIWNTRITFAWVTLTIGIRTHY